MQSHELGELAVLSGIWPLYEVEKGVLKLVGKTRDIADGRVKRLPVKDYLLRQGRFAHFTNDDLDYFQSKIDEMWDKWVIPGVIPFRKQIDEDRPPSAYLWRAFRPTLAHLPGAWSWRRAAEVDTPGPDPAVRALLARGFQPMDATSV